MRSPSSGRTGGAERKSAVFCVPGAWDFGVLQGGVAKGRYYSQRHSCAVGIRKALAHTHLACL